jgi:hypothetical protein
LSGVTAHATEKPGPFKFGTIPVLQSLPLFVAAEKGFFKEQGLNVDIVLFNSAMEKTLPSHRTDSRILRRHHDTRRSSSPTGQRSGWWP